MTVNPSPLEDREDAAIVDLVHRLQVRFSEQDPQDVSNLVHAHQLRLVDAPIRIFVPVLIEHACRSDLELARTPAA